MRHIAVGVPGERLGEVPNAADHVCGDLSGGPIDPRGRGVRILEPSPELRGTPDGLAKGVQALIVVASCALGRSRGIDGGRCHERAPLVLACVDRTTISHLVTMSIG